MGIQTVSLSSYSPDVAPCDFCLFPKLKENLRGCRYETIEEIKEAVTKVIDMLTQENLHGALKKLLEWYNKCIAAGGDYFEEDKSFMRVLSIKVGHTKKKSLETYWRPSYQSETNETRRHRWISEEDALTLTYTYKLLHTSALCGH